MIDVPAVLRKVGAIYTDGHFVLVGGGHTASYIRGDDLHPNTSEMWRLAVHLGTPFLGKCDVVMGPAFGGNPIAHLVGAWMCSKNQGVAWVPTEKSEGSQIVVPGRGFEHNLRGSKALVVEDTLSTGGSLAGVCDLARRHGGKVIGGAAISSYARSAEVSAMIGAPFKTLNEVRTRIFNWGECPMCAAQQPIVTDASLGHGLRYSRRHPDYPGGFVRLLDSTGARRSG